MSDSYSDYCERLEEKRGIYSKENFEVTKRTLKFKKAKARADDLLKEANFSNVKSCHNCRFYDWIPNCGGGSDDLRCSKMGLPIDEDEAEECVCGHWTACGRRKGSRPKFKIDDDVLAGVMIAKKVGDL